MYHRKEIYYFEGQEDKANELVEQYKEDGWEDYIPARKISTSPSGRKVLMIELKKWFE
jgi:hypothetical protein